MKNEKNSNVNSAEPLRLEKITTAATPRIPMPRRHFSRACGRL